MTDIISSTKAVAQMKTEELRAELAKGLQLTAAVLTRLGEIWAELERRGEDLSELRKGLARTLPLIASGRLAAEAVVGFAGRTSILKCLDGLPLDRQRELANGASVAVFVPGANEPDYVPLSNLPTTLVGLVFHNGEELTPVQQRLALTARRPPRKRPKRTYRVQFDAASQVVTIGNTHAPLTEIMAVVALAASDDQAVEDTIEKLTGNSVATAGCKLTFEEKERLLGAAKAAGCSADTLVRRAVLAWHLI